jgi:ketosteroid isomerase-like protein
MRSICVSTAAAFLVILSAVLCAQPGAGKLPPLKKQPTPKAVVDEHMDALNRCDWNRVMAQYPENVEFFLPGGQVVKGRQQVGELFRDALKPFKDGGICGITFEPEHTFVVGDTLNIQWKATAEGLAEPYKGADAYVTKGGYMAAMVTTFDPTQLKRKK